MFKKGICIIMTDKCNARYQICCFSCSPSKNNVIDETLMFQIIAQAKDLGNVEYIGFSGGEPFLYYELLKKGLNYAKKLGFKTSVATSFCTLAAQIFQEIVKCLRISLAAIYKNYIGTATSPPTISLLSCLFFNHLLN